VNKEQIIDSRPAPGHRAMRGNFSLRSFIPYLVAVAISVLLVVAIWHLNRIDLTVPIGVNGDHNFSQAIVTNFVRDGHIYVNPHLGAPGQQELYDYPLPHWIHFLLLALVRCFTSNPGLAINLLFFLGYPLAACTALFALRSLGVSTGLAVAGGVLYAFIPFHQLRNEAHLFYSAFYIVPLMALVAVWVASGRKLFGFERGDKSTGRAWITRYGALSLVVCILIAWDNPYNAFFGVCFLVVAALLRLLRRGDLRGTFAAAVLAIVVVSSFGLGLLPNTLYVMKHGRTSVAQRTPTESEIYGLTLIQLLAPVTNHRIAALANWKDHFRSRAVLVNENDTATLGIVGTIGAVALFLCLFWARCPDEIFALSALNLSAFLLGTIGGLGAIFSFVVSPQLRGFNRISVFISFFCIAGLLLLLDRSMQLHLPAWERLAGGFLVPALLLSIGLYDQVPRGVMLGHDQVERQYREDAAFIRKIESTVPPQSMIFQLPYAPFPESPPIYQMGDYEELRGYLHSNSLRWSYGALKGRATANWLQAISDESTDRMLAAVVGAGFAGIYIDRFGYADHGAALESQITNLLGGPATTDHSGRISFFALDHRAIDYLHSRLQPEARAELTSDGHPLLIDPGAGCWPIEQSGSLNWHWCGPHAEIELLNTSPSPQTVVIGASFSTASPEFANLTIDGLGMQDRLRINQDGTSWQAEVTVPSGSSTINVSTDGKKVIAPSDPRDLYFRINNFQYHYKERH
jgi:hypothetical protein